MGRSVFAIVCTLALVLAGCGADEVQQPGAIRWSPSAASDPGQARWDGQITVQRETGKLEAPGFNALIDSAAPAWAQAPDTTAAELLDLDRPFDGPVKIYLLSETDEGAPVVTVTLAGLADDSVEAIRYRVVLVKGGDGLHRFGSGQRTMLCQSGRGHRDFDIGLCS